MKIYTIVLLSILSISCNKEVKKEVVKKSKEESVLAFCKTDIALKSSTASSIVFDTVQTTVFFVGRKYPYYKKEYADVPGVEQTEDTISNKWSVSISFDSQNRFGAMIRNNISYIVKENTKYHHDTIFNPEYIILSKINKNELNEYLRIK